jgi:hypothetical protein
MTGYRSAATHTEEEILKKVRSMRPGENPVAADYDDMAAFCEGEPWHVFFNSEDNAPERIIFAPK